MSAANDVAVLSEYPALMILGRAKGSPVTLQPGRTQLSRADYDSVKAAIKADSRLSAPNAA